MGSPRNATRKPSVSAASSYQLRPGRDAETAQQPRADSAAELDDPAPPVEDDVVADGREPGRPHRGGAPWLVRPAQSGESIAGGLVGELPTRSGTAAAGRTRPQPTATRRSAARPSQSQGHRQRAPPARLAADFTLL